MESSRSCVDKRDSVVCHLRVVKGLIDLTVNWEVSVDAALNNSDYFGGVISESVRKVLETEKMAAKEVKE